MGSLDCREQRPPFPIGGCRGSLLRLASGSDFSLEAVRKKGGSHSRPNTNKGYPRSGVGAGGGGATGVTGGCTTTTGAAGGA